MEISKIVKNILKEISEVPKESYLKYEKLLDKLVDDVFADFVCGYNWETFNLHKREGTQLRIILYVKNVENLNFELYGQKKQELLNSINDFFPKFNGVFITTDTTKCGDKLNESEITERCWKGYTQKGMKTMFGKRYPNCVKIKKKKESKEGVGGYAAPAFEMEPDHVHFKHLYNESNMLIHTRRRLHMINNLLESLMYDGHNPCDYSNKDEYFDEIIHDLSWMVRNERYGLHDADWIDIYEYVVENKQDMIKEYFTNNCVGHLRKSIKNALDEQVTKKYPKPTEKVDKLVYRWLDNYFEGSQINKYEGWKYYSFRFEFCNNGRAIADLHVRFDDKSPDFGPKDRRPTNERSVEEVQLFIYPDMIYELLADIPIRKNYLLYLIEEWFEDTQLDKIQQEFNRNDLSLDYLKQSTKTRGDICVPQIPKPENISMQEMMDYIKKNTLYTYKMMEENEEEEPGWTEELYMGILQRKERERINQEDNEGTLREEVEGLKTSSLKDSIKQMINDESLTAATELFGGLSNLIKTVYKGDIKEFSKDTGTKLAWISIDGTRMFIHEVLIDELGLEDTSWLSRPEKKLGDFKFGPKNGTQYKFTSRVAPITINGQPYYKVVGTSGDSGFGYGFISPKNQLGKRYRAQIYNQIIDKFNLQHYM